MLSKRNFLTALSVVLITQLAAPLMPRALAQDAGSIDRLSGSATITGADKKTRPAIAAEKIQSGDTIATDGKGEAMVKLSDSTTVLLRPNSEFRFNEYKYENKTTDTVLSTLLRGTARLVTGLIGRDRPDRFGLTVKTATIGIRGTDFEVALMEDGNEAQARAGIYNVVNQGATHVALETGEQTDVKKDQTAFAPEHPAPGEPRLQLLDKRPVFLKAGGHDTMMQQIISQPFRAIQQMPRR